jgi:hypothetical protein
MRNIDLGRFPECGWELLALMRFPSDEIHRRGWCLREILRARSDSVSTTSEITIPNYQLRDLLAAPGGPALEQEGLDAALKGLLAGEITLAMFMMSKFAELGPPSLIRALKGLEAKLRGSRTSYDKPIRAAQTSLRAHHAEFRDVAHLWGALAFVKEFVVDDEANSLLQTAAGVEAFLKIAYAIQEFAIGHPMPAAESTDQRTLMNPQTAFLVPEEFSGWILPMEEAPKGFLKTYPSPMKAGRPKRTKRS